LSRSDLSPGSIVRSDRNAQSGTGDFSGTTFGRDPRRQRGYWSFWTELGAMEPSPSLTLASDCVLPPSLVSD